MAVDLPALFELLKERVYASNSRYPGYHDELMKTVADIIGKEQDGSGTIRRDVQDLIEVLGTVLDQNT